MITKDDLSNDELYGSGNNLSTTDISKKDVVLGMTALKYTQSNSICFVFNGNVIGIGAGQQNRVDCVKLAREKSKIWLYRMLGDMFDRYEDIIDMNRQEFKSNSERVNALYDCLENTTLTLNSTIFGLLQNNKNSLTLCSDGFFPFTDSIEEANKISVKTVAHPGGSNADPLVNEFCENNQICLIKTGYRYFYH